MSGVSKFRLGSSGDEITTCLKLNKNVPELRIGGVTTKLTTVSRPFVSETFSSCAQKCCLNMQLAMGKIMHSVFGVMLQRCAE